DPSGARQRRALGGAGRGELAAHRRLPPDGLVRGLMVRAFRGSYSRDARPQPSRRRAAIWGTEILPAEMRAVARAPRVTASAPSGDATTCGAGRWSSRGR